MATLWQLLTRKQQPEEIAEQRIYNPLGLTICGTNRSIITINAIGLTGIKFQVSSIRELRRQADDQVHQMVDYHLFGSGSTCLGNSVKIQQVLRLVPINGEASHNAALLEVVDSFGWNQDLYDKLNTISADRNSGDLHCDDDNTDWWRINDVEKPWEGVTTVTLEDLDGSSKVDPKEVRESTITYWDFWRQSGDGDNGQTPVVELLFFELSAKHHFSIIRGPQTDPQRIEVIA